MGKGVALGGQKGNAIHQNWDELLPIQLLSKFQLPKNWFVEQSTIPFPD
jgi:hypothetical protein